jgi:hypothetical protein
MGGGEQRDTYKILAIKPEGKTLGKTRHRSDDNIKMGRREIHWGVVD